ncbi:MAG TPA: acyloxyacyl hydrolase [Candidatus Acidoferrum sp.]|nr:acyloxyacyl hydrolase [Candidatus Acidoferrum sp.]
MQKSFLRHLRVFLFFSTSLFAIGEWRVNAQDFLTVGARGGLSINEGNHRFGQSEAFADFDLPWQWNFCSDWRLKPRIDVSAGYLGNETTSAFIGTAGPLLELRKGHFPLALEGGFSPTVISRYRFGSTDFGDGCQFTSHGGLTWYLTDHLSVGCRFQHMSNAGLAKPNPGLNVGMLVLSYHF